MSGFVSILPPIVAVGVALISRRISFSLFAGIWLGGVIVSGGHPVAGLDHAFDWMVQVITDDWNARFLLLISLLGAGAAFMYKIGGSDAVARALGKRITTRTQAQLLPYALGLLVFFNDYVNTVIVGNASRDICGKHRVSTEKLSYIIDSTAAPVAMIAPVSDWIGYQVALIGSVFATLSVTESKPYAAFLASIPWNFYCILAIAAVPMIVLLRRDFGPMQKAEHRALSTGELVAAGDVPLSDVDNDLGAPFDPSRASIWHFAVPLVVLIVATLAGLWHSGGGSEASDLSKVLEDADVSYALLWGSFSMTVAGILLAFSRRIPFAEIESIMLLGFRTILPALVIMILAWTIAKACDALDTAGYIIDISRDWMTPGILPILVFTTATTISFTTGTSWGTMAILTPIAVPIAYSLIGADADFSVVHIAIGAIFSGAVFGDHCSPISDTTVMSSIFAGADHIAHVRTQIPYALVPAGVGGILYLFSNLVANAFPLLLAGLVVQFLIFKFLAQSGNE